MARDLQTRFPSAEQADCEAIFKFLIPMYHEVGRIEGDAATCMGAIYATVRDDFVFLVMDGAEIVASAGLVQVPAWYTKGAQIWTERWFYVAQDHRDDPAIAAAMFGEVQHLVDATGTMALITVFNKKRFVRGHRTVWGQVGEKFAIRPAGSVIAIQPGADHVRVEREVRE